MRALLLAALWLASGCSREAGPDPFAGMDATVRKVLAAVPSSTPWVSETRPHVTAHALSPLLLSDAAAQAEFALSQIHQRFAVPASPGLLHLVVVPPEVWAALVPQAREKGVTAISFGGTLVVRAEGGRVAGIESVCHEAVHAFAALHLHPRPPLWLEEGLAVHWGAQLAADLHRLRGETVVQREHVPPAPVAAPLSLDAYPEDPVELAAFHARCGRLVADLETRIGRDALPATIRAAARDPSRFSEAP